MIHDKGFGIYMLFHPTHRNGCNYVSSTLRQIDPDTDIFALCMISKTQSILCDTLSSSKVFPCGALIEVDLHSFISWNVLIASKDVTEESSPCFPDCERNWCFFTLLIKLGI